MFENRVTLPSAYKEATSQCLIVLKTYIEETHIVFADQEEFVCRLMITGYTLGVHSIYYGRAFYTGYCHEEH